MGLRKLPAVLELTSNEALGIKNGVGRITRNLEVVNQQEKGRHQKKAHLILGSITEQSFVLCPGHVRGRPGCTASTHMNQSSRPKQCER